MKGKPKVKPKAKNPKSMRLGSLERQPSSPSAPLNNRRQSKNKGWERKGGHSAEDRGSPGVCTR